MSTADAKSRSARQTQSSSAGARHLANIARWLSGRKLKWDPKKEQFIGDDESNTYLDRPRRKPWVIEDV